MAKYELALIFTTSPADEETPKQIEQVKEWLAGIGAEISDVDIWGRKRLAYPIRKQPEGMYVLYYFELEDGRKLKDLNRRFNTAEFVLRYLSVRLPAMKEVPRISKYEPAPAPPEKEPEAEGEGAVEEPEGAEGAEESTEDEATTTEEAPAAEEEAEPQIELEAETPAAEPVAESAPEAAEEAAESEPEPKPLEESEPAEKDRAVESAEPKTEG